MTRERGSVLTALAIDLLFGEPPTRIHPTVAMGRWISAGRSRRRSRARTTSFVEGAAIVASGALTFGALGAIADRSVSLAPRPARALARGALLKPTLSVRALLGAASEVEQRLREGNIVDARRSLSWHLVSRDTSTLSAGEIAGAAIESLAENFNDGFVAPVLWYKVAGLGSAYAFRFVNTADAMVGYHTDELEWFGKAAARLDDAVAFAPARLSALLIALTARVGRASSQQAVRAMLRDSSITSSPNAGWPMAAMAGALGVELTKRNHYTLNAGARAPNANDIREARRIVFAAAVLGSLVAEAL